MSDTVAPKRWKKVVRTFLASTVSVLVVLAAITAGAALWIKTSAFDSDAVAADARVFLKDPALNKEVAKFLTDTAVDLGEQVRDSSRDRNLGRVMGQALTREKISPLAESIAASDTVIDSLASLVEQAHRQMLDIAQGKSTEPVNVSLNLVPVVVSILDEMKTEKIIPNSVKLPELAAGALPEEDIAAFAKAFKMKLKNDFGQLMIVNKMPKNDSVGGQPGTDKEGKEDKGMAYSDLDGRLARATTAFTGLFLLLLVLIVIVVFLAPTRRRGFRMAAGALLVASLASAVAVRVAPSNIESTINDGTQAKVIRAILDAVLSSYATLTTIMLVLSMGLVGASIWGPTLMKRVSLRRGT